MRENPEAETGAPIRALYIDDERELLELTSEFLETQTDRITVTTTSSPHRGSI